MTLLAVNKQLDLQSALTAVGRCMAQLQGWYLDRADVQRGFILDLLIVTLLGMITSLILMRRHLRRNGLALIGLAFVAGFVGMRAVVCHDVDHLISSRFLNLRLNFLLDVSGLILNAFALLRRPYVRARRPIR